MANMRKHFPKNQLGQIMADKCDYELINLKANKLVTEFLKEFSEWDIDDLMRVLSLSGNWAATMVMMEEEQESYEAGNDKTKIRKEYGDD